MEVFGDASTEQCAASDVTPHRVNLVPADRDCKGIGFPVRWFHTFVKKFLLNNVIAGNRKKWYSAIEYQYGVVK